MFKSHDSGILTLSLYTTYTHVFCLVRHYFTNARQMRCTARKIHNCNVTKKINKRLITYNISTYAICMLYVQTTVYNVHKGHLFCTHIYIYQSITDYLYVHCTMYRLYIGTRVRYILCVVCI